MVLTTPMPMVASATVSALYQPWLWLAVDDIVLIGIASLIFCGAMLSITQAFRISIVSTIAPFEYSYLLWALVIGYLYFGEVPSPRTLLGGTVIVICGCYIIYRERRLARLAIDN